MAMVRPLATNPAQKLIFLLFTSAEGKGSPLPFWGPSQSFGFSLFPSWCPATWVRSSSTNICLSPLWPTFSLNGHFFWLLDTANSTREDSISLTSSSPWAITWHQFDEKTVMTFYEALCTAIVPMSNDFNAHVGRDFEICNVFGRYGIGKVNTNSVKLLGLRSEFISNILYW